MATLRSTVTVVAMVRMEVMALTEGMEEGMVVMAAMEVMVALWGAMAVMVQKVGMSDIRFKYFTYIEKYMYV